GNNCHDYFYTNRICVNFNKNNLIDIAAIVLSVNDIKDGKLEFIHNTGYDIPVFITTENDDIIPSEYLQYVRGVFSHNDYNIDLYSKQLEIAASNYEKELFPPFFKALVDYVNKGTSAFDCPGNQGGEFFRRHPVGNQFV
ncbi:ornithine decarboxylase, partial [Escherichia coli]|nr:ornithine decarboxylase [Escherichia coli]